MANPQQTLFVDQDPSYSKTQGRTVEDTIRNLVSESAQVLALVAKGTVTKGQVARGPGMISKKSSQTARIEAFTHTPIEHTIVVVSESTLDIVFASVASMHVRQVWRNTRNNTVGIVDQIATLTVSFISLGATFSCLAGDVLIRLGNAYEYGSSDPAYIQKPDDQIYNVLQIFRFPVEISRSLKSTKQLAGGDYFKRMKMYAVEEGYQDVERALIWGQKSNTTTTNVTTSTVLAVDVPHMEGMWNFAQNAYSFGNSFTPEKFTKNMILAMHRSVGNTKPLIFLTSREAVARALAWQYDKLLYNKGGELAKFGIKSHTFMTSGPDVHMIAHAAFDYGSDTDKGLLFIPENYQYRFKEGADLHPKSNIQSPSKDGFMDEILGEVGGLPLDGGYTMTKITDIF